MYLAPSPRIIDPAAKVFSKARQNERRGRFCFECERQKSFRKEWIWRCATLAPKRRPQSDTKNQKMKLLDAFLGIMEQSYSIAKNAY